MINKSVVLISLLVGLTTIGFSENNTSLEKNKTKEDNGTKPIKVEEKVAPKTSVTDSMEDQIQKALLGVSSLKVLKAGESKIVFESEAMVLDRDKPKEVKKIKKKRKVRKKSIRRKHKTVKSADMNDLPMAKTYPMDYELSKIKE